MLLQDMDLYDQSRTLLHAGALYRRYRSKADMSHTWAELHVALLDNYCEFPAKIVRHLLNRPLLFQC